MPQSTFDDPQLRAAMSDFVAAAAALDEASAVGGEPRDLMDLAEAKTVAGLRLRKRLTDLGWQAPAVRGTDECRPATSS